MSYELTKSGFDVNGYPWAESADGKVRAHVNAHDDPTHGKSFILVGEREDEPRSMVTRAETEAERGADRGAHLANGDDVSEIKEAKSFFVWEEDYMDPILDRYECQAASAEQAVRDWAIWCFDSTGRENFIARVAESRDGMPGARYRARIVIETRCEVEAMKEAL